jgi:acetylornithine deacetylase/succinyl-diaminopimelate desuccinylase family protein
MNKLMEKKIVGNISEKDVLSLAKEMIKINSENPPGNEKALADYMVEVFNGIGLKALQLDFLPNRPNVVALYGSRDQGRSLIFDGHLDTVPCGDLSLWSINPLEGAIRNGQLYGRGATDMKSSIAAFTCALKAIVDSGIKLKGQVTIVLTSDEEISGLGTKSVLEKGYHADAAIVGEPSNLEVNTAHKGVARWRLTTFGKAAHASAPQEGVNAIYKMAKAVIKLEEIAEKYLQQERTHPILGRPTLNVGIIRGGIKDNIVPDYCEITIDRRLLPGETWHEVEKEFRGELEKLSREDPNFKYELKLYHAHNAAETPSTHPFVKLAKNAVKDVLGRESTVEGFVATTEMSHLVEAGIPSIILGCGDLKVAHTINEYVPVQQIIDATKIYTLIILRYLGTQ